MYRQMSTAPTNFIAFMCHTQRKHYDYLEETLQEYNIGQYLIGYEASPYEHFHFIVQMTSADYHKYSERVFRKKLKLKGRWFKEGNETFPRQYGKVSEIQDLEKMKSYTIKDGDFRSNMPEQDVQRYFENSHKKEQQNQLRDKCVEHLEEDTDDIEKFTHSNGRFQFEKDYIQYNVKYLELKIINYLRLNTDKHITKSFVKLIVQDFIKKTSHIDEESRDIFIYYSY